MLWSMVKRWKEIHQLRHKIIPSNRYLFLIFVNVQRLVSVAFKYLTFDAIFGEPIR